VQVNVGRFPINRFGLVFGLALIIGAFGLVAPVRAELPASDANVLKWAALSVGFEETFVPTAVTSPEEDAALTRAITTYRRRTKVDDFSARGKGRIVA
jgi:hypothetical protein